MKENVFRIFTYLIIFAIPYYLFLALFNSVFASDKVIIAPPCDFVYPIDEVNTDRVHWGEKDGLALDLGGNGRPPKAHGIARKKLVCKDLNSYSSIEGIVRKRIDSKGGWYTSVIKENLIKVIQNHYEAYDPNIIEEQHVSVGDRLGTIGETGLATFKHIHLEVFKKIGGVFQMLPYNEWEFGYGIPEIKEPEENNTVINTDILYVEWYDIEYAIGYEIQVGIDQQVNLNIPSGKTNFSIQIDSFSQDLENYNWIPFKVRALLEEGPGEWSGEKFFTKSEVIQTSGMNFSDVGLKGITLDPSTDDLRFVFEGIETVTDGEIIDLDGDIDHKKKLFLQALAIPNYKHWISLDILKGRDGLYGKARTISPFEETDLAREFFEADVELKYDMFTNQIGGSSLDEGEKADWVNLILDSPYYTDLMNVGFDVYPEWLVRAEIVPGNVNSNDENGTIFFNNSDININYEVENVSIDLSSFNLTREIRDDLYTRLDQFKTLLFNRLQRAATATSSLINGSDPSYGEIREIYPILAAAQWYKKINIPNKPYANLIDSENLSGIEGAFPYDQSYWDSQAFHYLSHDQTWTDFTGAINSVQAWGGISLDEVNLLSLGDLELSQNNIFEETLNSDVITIDSEHFINGGLIGNHELSVDLTIGSINLSDNVAQGEVVDIEIEIINVGKAENVDFELKIIESIGNSKKVIRNEHIIGYIDNFESRVITVPWNPVYPSKYKIEVTIESPEEFNQKNNSNFEEFTVLSNIPEVNILEPIGNSVVVADHFNLDGSVYDPKDGFLEDSSIEWYSNIDGNIGTGEFLNNPSLSLGDHIIYLRGTNSRGYMQEDQIRLRIVNIEYPIVSILSPSSGSILSSDIDLNFEAEAQDLIEGNLCHNSVWTSSIDGYIGEGCSIITKLSIGDHEITFKSTNTNGLSSESMVNISVENGFPELNIDFPRVFTRMVLEGTTSSNVWFNTYIIDNRPGPFTIEWESDLDGYLGSGDDFVASLSIGNHLLTASAIDQDGLKTTKTMSMEILDFDAENPIFMIAGGPPPNLNIEGTSVIGDSFVDSEVRVNIDIDSINPLDQAMVEIDGVSHNLLLDSETGFYYADLTLPSLPGIYNLRFLASNDREMAVIKEIGLEVFERLPDLLVKDFDIYFEKGKIIGNLMNMGFIKNLEVEVGLKVDSVDIANQIVLIDSEEQEFIFPWSGIDGDYEVEIMVDESNVIDEQDKSNNISIKDINVLRTDLLPNLEFAFSEEHWTDNPLYRIAWIYDPDFLYEYRLNKGSWLDAGNTGELDVLVDQEGENLFEFRYKDYFGNLSEISTAFLKYDISNPTILEFKESIEVIDWSYQSTKYIEWYDSIDSGSGIEYYEIQINDREISSIGNVNEYTVEFDHGVNYFKIRAVDYLGNRSDWAELIYNIDILPPESPSLISSHSNSSLWYSEGDINFEIIPPIDDSGISGYYYAINKNNDSILDNSNRWNENNELSFPNIKEGEWYIHVAAQDNVGNIGETIHFVFKIDNSSPITKNNFDLIDHSIPYTLNLDSDDYLSGVRETKYRINRGVWHIGNEILISGDTRFVEYYSIDNAGNEEEINRIDLIEPVESILEVPINASVNDGFESASGGINLTRENIKPKISLFQMLNLNNTIGLRFENIEIPRGANIIDANIELTGYNTTWRDARLELYVENVNNSSVFENILNNFTSRIFFTPIGWNLGVVYDGQKYLSPNLSSKIQDLVDREDWTSGNNISLFLQSNEGKSFYAYDGDPSNSAKLIIRYLY